MRNTFIDILAQCLASFSSLLLFLLKILLIYFWALFFDCLIISMQHASINILTSWRHSLTMNHNFFMPLYAINITHNNNGKNTEYDPDHNASNKCSGSFINPITDVCWNCMFPIYISPMPIKWTGGRHGSKGGVAAENNSFMQLNGTGDGITLPTGICFCKSRSIFTPGILISFYEPTRSVDITKSPFCLVGLGGIDMGSSFSDILPSATFGEEVHGMQTRSSFYQMHWYANPILALLELLDIGCGMDSSIDIMFFSELDPLWNDDELAFIFSPEAVLFTSLEAQLACSADCIATSMRYSGGDINVGIATTDIVDNLSFRNIDNKISNTGSKNNPSKYLYWCAGCQGSLFPLNGHNIDAHYAVQTSILTACKANVLMHRMMLQTKTTGYHSMCNAFLPDIFLDKSEWKYSMLFPKRQTTSISSDCCNTFGETDIPWNSGASYPYKGENFHYLWYHQRDCCYY